MSKNQKVPALEDRTTFPTVPFVLLDKLQNEVHIEALFNLCLELLLHFSNNAD